MTERGIPLYGYQRRWLADDSRFKIGRWSRQTGKTFTCSLEIVDDIYSALARGRSSSWLVMSRGERQAREAMRSHIQRHARAYGMALEARIDVEIEIDGQTYRADEWDAGRGCVVTALPANPDTARGYSRNLWLDEFAIHQKDREIWAAVYPSITRGGLKIRITSTPKGKKGKFYEIDTSTDGQWSKHVVTIHQAVADGLPADIDELRAGLADPELWRQEYLCEYVDEASAWLTYDLIDRCEHPDAGDPGAFGKGAVFIGNDIARKSHLWVAWAIELVGDVAWTREIRELRNEPFRTHDSTLDEMFERYRPVRIAMDETGLGMKPVEDAERRYGESVVEGVAFTAARKLVLATALRERFEDRTIRIPAGNRLLRTDLHSVQKVAGPTGAPRLIADDDESHADRFWAAALAASAAAGPVGAIGYRPVRPEPGGEDDDLPPLGWDGWAADARFGAGAFG